MVTRLAKMHTILKTTTSYHTEIALKTTLITQIDGEFYKRHLTK